MLSIFRKKKKFDLFLFMASLSSMLNHRKIERERQKSLMEVSRRAYMRRAVIPKYDNDPMYTKCPYCGERYFKYNNGGKHVYGACVPLSEAIMLENKWERTRKKKGQ